MATNYYDDSGTYCKDCDRYYRLNKDGFWTYPYHKWDRSFKIVDPSEIRTHISKPFFESYMEIRDELEDQKKVVEMKEFGKDFLEDKKIREFVELRFKTLKLIEYGIVWLYFDRKNQGSGKNKEVSKTLKHLKFLIDSIIGQITNKSGAKVLEDIASLEKLYSKALTMF